MFEGAVLEMSRVTLAGVAGVVLAAGTGRRMGRPKALVELDGRSLVDRAAETLLQGGCSPVAVVVGAAAHQVRQQAPDDVQVIDNPDWPTGMASSVRSALGWAADTSSTALLVLPVDTPGIGPSVIRRMLDRWAQQAAAAAHADRPGPGALVATYDGRRRNPVLLSAAVWDRVAARVQGDSGAKDWLRDNPDRVAEVDCTDLGVPTDLDTPDDLARWTNRPDVPAGAPTTGERHGA